jgi:nucleoside-diphosphate-sugar epimerase
MESQRVLITGANGFLGSNIANRLSSAGLEVYAVVRENTNLWRIENIRDSNIIKIGEYNSKNLEAIFAKSNPEVVINAVGIAQRKTVNKTEHNWNSNFLTLISLVDAMKQFQIRQFIHLGSSFEYGASAKFHQALKENVRCRPVSEYGIAKLFQTEYLEKVSENYKFSSMVLRIFNVFGPFEEQSRLVPQVTIKAIKNEDIVLSNPEAIRDFIYVADVVEAIFKAVRKEFNKKFDTLNVGSGAGTTVMDVATKLVSIANSSSRILPGERDQRPENYISPPIADIKKIHDELGWALLYSLTEGLKETYSWLSQHLSLY